MNTVKSVMVAALGIGLGARVVSAQARDPSPRPRAYGTSVDSAYHLGASDFVPRDSTIAYTEPYNTTVARYTTACVGLCLIATPHLPEGALLTGILGYFCDSDPSHDVGIVVAKTLYDGTALTTLGEVTSNGSSEGCGVFEYLDLTPFNYQVNYQNNQLVLLSDFGVAGGAVAIAGATLYYRLQVSPAPPTATFGDVPLTDPAFQFIEALAASGITAGCGGGNYCPDAPLTRRQMAVYLAKALGLQWQ